MRNTIEIKGLQMLGDGWDDEINVMSLDLVVSDEEKFFNLLTDISDFVSSKIAKMREDGDDVFIYNSSV